MPSWQRDASSLKCEDFVNIDNFWTIWHPDREKVLRCDVRINHTLACFESRREHMEPSDLRRIPLFASLSDERLVQLLAHSHIGTYPRGACLLGEHQHPDALY